MSIVISGDGTITGLTTTGISPVQQLPAGSVLQVVQGSSLSYVSTTSTSFVTTGFSASITPKFATSKVLVLVNGEMVCNSTNSGIFTVYRGGTNIGNGSEGVGVLSFAGGGSYGMINSATLDAPATTSSTTYTIYYRTSSATVYIGYPGVQTTITLMEIAQ